ncbi:MAG: hypothetical protein WC908_02710 [Candidatus Paceibacterota bacterium]
MKKNQTTLILIFSIIATILAICLFFFLLKVIKNKNQQASVVFTTLEKKIREKENTIMFAEKVAEIKLLQDSVNSYFVDPNRIDIFVGYLEEIGSSVGGEVIVQSIEVPLKTKSIISFKLSILGTFEEVMKTIALLENIPYQIDITQVYLNKDIIQGTQGDVKDVKKEKVVEIPTWQADISFNILSSD